MSRSKPTQPLMPMLGESQSHLAAELAEQYEELLAQFKQLQQLYEEQSALLAKLQQQAPLDDVTGLANRRSLQDEIVRSLAQARRHGRTHALLVFRLEDFDTYRALGEATEHDMLRHMARLLRQNIRPTDIAARLTEGTFAVLLNEVRAADNASQRTQAIMDVAAQTPCMTGGRSLHLSVQAGACTFGADDEVQAIFASAEAALGQHAPVSQA